MPLSTTENVCKDVNALEPQCCLLEWIFRPEVLDQIIGTRQWRFPDGWREGHGGARCTPQPAKRLGIYPPLHVEKLLLVNSFIFGDVNTYIKSSQFSFG
jgi:hypothetical protein